MEVFTSLAEVKQRKFTELSMALGTFDGLHIGHQDVIAQAVRLAKEHHGTSAVFTFSTHPLTIVAPDKQPLLINDELAKIRNIEALGVDVLINIPFTKELAGMSPQEFMQMLQDVFAVKYLVSGPNFSFGYQGKGTPELLRKEGHKYGFTAYVHASVYDDDTMVSSTEIRQALEQGDLVRVNRLLGKPFSINEEVIHGKKRGRELGFPTANLAIHDERAMLPDGVYIVYAFVAGQRYQAVASIGTNPTFQDISRRVEVFILGFDRYIYGEIIRVDFLQRIRPELKFDSREALITRMHEDIAEARQYFATHQG